jgi:hypothetical protein
VSRQREFLADARAVQWTRNREGLGRVLRKVLGQQVADDTADLTHPSVQHMLLVSGESGWLGRWFDAHPPLGERIERIYGGRMPALSPVTPTSSDAGGFADTLPMGMPSHGLAGSDRLGGV